MKTEKDNKSVIISYDGKTFMIQVDYEILGREGELIMKVPTDFQDACSLLTEVARLLGKEEMLKRIGIKYIEPEDEKDTVPVTRVRRTKKQQSPKPEEEEGQ